MNLGACGGYLPAGSGEAEGKPFVGGVTRDSVEEHPLFSPLFLLTAGSRGAHPAKWLEKTSTRSPGSCSDASPHGTDGIAETKVSVLLYQPLEELRTLVP